MPEFPNPRLAAISEALTQLEPLLQEVGRPQGFKLVRGRESYRYLHRDLPGGVRHEIGLIISIPMSERLERGFFPEIPCTLYAAAFHRAAHKHYHTEIFTHQPFSSMRASLSAHLRQAVAELEICTADFVVAHGTPDNSPTA